MLRNIGPPLNPDFQIDIFFDCIIENTCTYERTRFTTDVHSVIKRNGKSSKCYTLSCHRKLD